MSAHGQRVGSETQRRHNPGTGSLTPRSRTAGMLILVLAMLFAVELDRRGNNLAPAPFLLLFSTVGLTAAFTGIVPGLVAATLVAGFTVFSWTVGYGPETLTGTPANLIVAIAGAYLLAALLGYDHDRRTELLHELRQREQELLAAREHLTGSVEKATQDLQRLTRLLFDVQEEERATLAHELHDEIGQILTGIKLNLSSNHGGLPVREKIDESIALLDKLADSVRQISLDLRPSALDDLGLVATIRAHLERQQERSGVRCALREPGDLATIGPETTTVAYRLIQEAVNNALKHSATGAVGVRLANESNDLIVTVTDSGTGFDVALARPTGGKHLGLLFMRERVRQQGGILTIDSTLGEGTTITARLPLEAKSPNGKN